MLSSRDIILQFENIVKYFKYQYYSMFEKNSDFGVGLEARNISDLPRKCGKSMFRCCVVVCLKTDITA